MPETTTTTTNIDQRVLCSLEVERKASGLLVKCKSDVIEEYMKNLAGDNIGLGDGTWGKGMKYYKIPSLPIENDGTYHKAPEINKWGMESIIDMASRKSNFSFIRSVGLKDGVEIKYNGLFLNKDIEQLKEDFANFIKKFHISYIKVMKFKISITTEI